ncbi:MAG: CpsD/CapB family tyrosine-protein kinase [Candidatus Cohnella colombiensis]|uniref:non-specific protein-tyrosine kinase n=1 Tax=Candidatus Cohnella colombiensis TaxID=3121368 RepID=A0AA95JEV6_9BACL|nr:MAG: CpsD/CapB family tyrosine-protein kinase [Cohnella sp.]
MTSRKKLPVLHTSLEANNAITEAYRNLRASLTYYAWDKRVQTLVFTSLHSGDGTTSLIANLAVLSAQEYKRVLLIDGQLRKPKLHHYFLAPNHIGLSDVLSDKAKIVDVLVETNIEHLTLLPAGPLRVNSAELLGTHKLSRLLESFQEKFDVILIDSPAVLHYSDTGLWARASDGVVIVVNSKSSKSEHLQRAEALLDPFQEKLVGVIMVK